MNPAFRKLGFSITKARDTTRNSGSDSRKSK